MVAGKSFHDNHFGADEAFYLELEGLMSKQAMVVLSRPQTKWLRYGWRPFWSKESWQHV